MPIILKKNELSNFSRLLNASARITFWMLQVRANFVFRLFNVCLRFRAQTAKKICLRIFSFENIFSMTAIFARTLHIFLNPISKIFCNFSLKLNIANRRHVFLALWTRKLRDTLIKRKTKCTLTCNVQKVFRAFAFRSREKFDNSFLFKIVGIVW